MRGISNAGFIPLVLYFLSVLTIRAVLGETKCSGDPALDDGKICGASASKIFQKEAQEQCFCQLKGQVDDCACSVDTVDHYNNAKIFPLLQSLLNKDYFRYFKHNPSKPCSVLRKSTIDKCSSPGCFVKECARDKLPPGLRDTSRSEEASQICDSVDDAPVSDDRVDETMSESALKDIASWKTHDDSVMNFCEMDDENCPDCVHVDLTRNPERYTGYGGEASKMIWKAIYEENCFRPQQTKEGDNPPGFFVPQKRLAEMCLEKRAFYRSISGLHSSITVHLSSKYPYWNVDGQNKASDSNDVKGGPSAPMGGSVLRPPDRFDANLDLFISRFSSATTHGEGPFWLKNLYFVYLLELRALLKAAPYLERHVFYTGDKEEDEDTHFVVTKLLDIVRSFPDHYDESQLFTGGQSDAALKEEFRTHFRNISMIMDCVSCDKCKLWGKLQVTGLGTALKILFSSEDAITKAAAELGRKSGGSSLFHLCRNEIISLFNSFGRISTSIQQLENFREMMRDGDEELKRSDEL